MYPSIISIIHFESIHDKPKREKQVNTPGTNVFLFYTVKALLPSSIITITQKWAQE